MKNFPAKLLMPPKTISGKGTIFELVDEAVEFGKRGLIIHGTSLESSAVKNEILRRFAPASRVICYCRSGGEPTLAEIRDVIRAAKKAKADWIAGIGGGSVLDLAKVAAGLYNANQQPVFYQDGGKLKEMGIPFIAVPTTAGTGSEATINSVIIDREKKVKRSIRDESFLAKKIILDPELLKSLPPEILRYGAMDAYVQAFESFISKNATWFSDTLSLRSLELIDKNILPAYESGNEDSLSCLLLASYLGAMAFSSSRLGVIHGVAHPLGALYDLPHGLVCSVCFIPAIKINKKAIGYKYDILSNMVGLDFLRRIEKLLGILKISSPFKDKALEDKKKIIEAALDSGSTAANPKEIIPEDIEFLLAEIF